MSVCATAHTLLDSASCARRECHRNRLISAVLPWPPCSATLRPLAKARQNQPPTDSQESFLSNRLATFCSASLASYSAPFTTDMAHSSLAPALAKKTLNYVVLTWIALVFIFPIVFMVVSSLKPDLQLLRDSASINAFLPVGDISLDNYHAAFRRVPIAHFITNSVMVTGITMLFSLAFCSMAGFAFVFLDFPGRSIMLAAVLATFIVPFESIAIPLLLVVNNLPWIGAEGIQIGWLNSYHVQIIPFISDALTIFLFVQYFRDLPKELVEAARVDGASYFQIYRRVILPLSGPVFATAAILKFLAMYNQFLWPVMSAQTEQYRPIMVGLQYFFQLNIAWGEMMAYLTIITIPVLLFYLSLQRAFIASIASTGIKG